MEYKLILESKAVVRFQDCDPFNHLNNGNYINYFMNHREDQIKENYDLDVFKIAENTGKSWVIGSNQIAYFKPAKTMETVTIQSQLFKFTDSELLVEMRMYNEEKTHLKAIIWTSFIHYNLLELKKEKHNNDLMKLFKQFIYPFEDTIFEKRVKNIKLKKILQQ